MARLAGAIRKWRVGIARRGPRPFRAVPLVSALLLATVLPAAASAATYSISGIVTEVSGAPVEGIQLAVCRLDQPGQLFLECLGEVATAADGTYRVDHIPPGSYLVSFDDPTHKHPTAWYSPAGFTADTNNTTTVVVDSADLTGISVRYPVLHTISGRVTGPGGMPVGPEVTVIACPSDGSSACASMFAPVGADGTYSVVVPVGLYTIMADDSSGTYIPTYFMPNLKFQVPSVTDPTDISIQFAAAGHISGTLRASGPWRYLRVTACSTRRDCYDATVRPDGTYKLAVTPGTYTLSFLDPEGVVVPGWWTAKGLVGIVARATVIDVTKSDFKQASATTGPITAGIHAGTAKTGSFTTKQLVVRDGSSVTVRFKIGAGFSGTKASIWVATGGSDGKLGTFRKVGSTAVRSDGYVFHTTRVTGLMAFRLQATFPTTTYLVLTSTSTTVQAKGS